MSAKKNEAIAEDTKTEVPQETTEDATQDTVLDDEIERLIPGPGEPLELHDGTLVAIRPLKLKELLAAMKVVTRGATMSMGALSFNIFQENTDRMVETLVALLINAFPEADVEFCEFLRVVVEPFFPDNDATREEMTAAHIHLDEILVEDPDIGDALDILTVLFSREAKDMQRLGKKVSNAVQVFTKVQPKIPQK